VIVKKAAAALSFFDGETTNKNVFFLLVFPGKGAKESTVVVTNNSTW
jgi:hypothetical protein